MGVHKDATRAAGFYWVEPWLGRPGHWVLAQWVPAASGHAWAEAHWLLFGQWWDSVDLVTIDEHEVGPDGGALRGSGVG